MSDANIAKRYAEAFIELAHEAGDIDGFAADLRDFAELLGANGGQLSIAMSSPVFTKDERRQVLDAVLPRLNAKQLTLNLIHLLNDNGRFSIVPSLVREYGDLADARAGRVRVQVRSAEPLSPQLEAEVRVSLERATGKKVLLETSVDPSLLGGLIARVGSRVYDSSLKTRLVDLQHRLFQAPSAAQA